VDVLTPSLTTAAAPRLNRHFLDSLSKLAKSLAPLASGLEARFRSELRKRGMEAPEIAAISAVTTGALAEVLQQRRHLDRCLEEVHYRGRRLAKLGLLPAEVSAALRIYDGLLDRALRRTNGDSRCHQWPLSQLAFVVMLALNDAYYRVRESESRAFYDLFRAELEGGPPEAILSRFLSVLAEYAGAREARVFLRNGGQPAWDAQLLEQARCFNPAVLPAAVLDPAWNSWCRTCWSIPLKPGGELSGVVQLGFAKEYEWLPRERELLLAASERCSQAFERARLIEDLARREEQIRRLAGHMIEVEESERSRISRELHDEAGQSLLCMRLQLEMLEQGLPADAGPARARLAEIRTLAEDTIVEIRRLIAALSPSILDRMGLAAALRQLGARFRQVYPCRLRLALPRRIALPRQVEIVVYRLTQEILNNIAKYSGASTVNISLKLADGMLRMHVEDDGVGFDYQSASARRECFGLAGIRERVALLGGSVRFNSVVRNQPPAAGERGWSDAPGGTIIDIELAVAGGVPQR
jgi:signal transduction histidine kinase